MGIKCISRMRMSHPPVWETETLELQSFSHVLTGIRSFLFCRFILPPVLLHLCQRWPELGTGQET